MINLYTIEKWKQIIAYNLRKVICFFIFFNFGLFFSKEIHLNISLDLNPTNNLVVTDSSNSKIFSTGGAVIINHEKVSEQKVTIKNKKQLRANKNFNKRQFSKKIVKKKKFITISYQNLIHQTKFLHEIGFIDYCIVNLVNSTSKYKSFFPKINHFLAFILAFKYLKSKSFKLFLRRIFFNFYHSTRPPPIF